MKKEEIKSVSLRLPEGLFIHLQKTALLKKEKFSRMLRRMLVEASRYGQVNLHIEQFSRSAKTKDSDLDALFAIASAQAKVEKRIDVGDLP